MKQTLRQESTGTNRSRSIFLLLAAVVFGGQLSSASAQSVYREDFEGPLSSLKPAGRNVESKIPKPDRVRGTSHSGQWSEHLRIQAGNGSYIYYSQFVGQAHVISELQPSIWVKADRPGVRILAQVVLPRTTDPKSGKPIRAVIRGDVLQQAGKWQRLSIDKVPQRLAQQVRVLRSQLRRPIDQREAYIDHLVLNVFTGAGVTNVWVDSLEIAGFVGRRPGQRESDVPLRSVATQPKEDLKSSSEVNSAPRVRFQGPVLLVNGRPFFPRIIEYQGESLKALKDLGFNTVQLARAASLELLREAEQTGMWVVCPAPRLEENSNIGSGYDRVLAWDLGKDLSREDLDRTRKTEQRLRAADPISRPRFCHVRNSMRAFSRLADVILLDRRVAGTSLEMSDYGAWLRFNPQLARPGTPVWTVVDTQLSDEQIEQLEIISGGRHRSRDIDTQTLQLATITALASGARGILFRSGSRLDGKDVAVRRRAAALKWLNLQMKLIEPWLTEGRLSVSTESSDARISLTTFQSRNGKFGRLVIAMRRTPGSQFVPGSSPKPISLTVSGIPETHDAYRLTPAGMRRLSSRRVAGGMLIKLDALHQFEWIVFSPNALVYSVLNRNIRATRQEAVELSRDLARFQLAETVDIARRLPLSGAGKSRTNHGLELARNELGQSETFSAAGDFLSAARASRNAAIRLDTIRRAAFIDASASFTSPMNSPLSGSFASLPEFWQFTNRLKSLRAGSNLVTGGDCESLGVMMKSGWKHYQHRQSGIRSVVELSPTAPADGRMSLRLAAQPTDSETGPEIVEQEPVWIVTHEVMVRQGTLLRISGKVRIPSPITGSVDGLRVIDSIGGEPMSLRFGHAPSWKSFTMYRVAPRTGQVHLAFALSGLGEAWIDEIAIRPMIGLPPLRR